MVLSKPPFTSLLKRCGLHHHLSSSRRHPTKVQNSSILFSSLAKLQHHNDDDDHDDDITCSNDSNVHRQYNNNNIESKVSLTYTNSNTNTRFLYNTNTNNMNRQKMPRLHQLRQRLANENEFENTLSSYSTKQEVKSNHNSNNRIKTSISSLKDDNHTDNMTWREIVQMATEQQIRTVNNNILIDSYQRKHSYLRISLGERCNLRCLYCMPPEGVPLQPSENILSTEEISRLVSLFSSHGVDKVRLTGGEPLLRHDLPQIISSISSDSKINSVGITTNGITLTRHLPSLIESGLTHANISLDTLQANKFLEITRRKGLSQVMKAIENASEQLPAGNVKVNCVVMKGFNDNELRDFVHLTKDLPVDVRFIEWMPFNDNGWNKDRFLSYSDMMRKVTSDEEDFIENGQNTNTVASLQDLSPFVLNRLEDGPNDTTKWWQVPGHIGRVGFITSMTQHFCGSCNRLRVTADGQLKVCLFGSTEVSLRDAMREGASNDDIGKIIWAALQNKHFALGGHGNAEGIKKANNNRPMTLIGG